MHSFSAFCSLPFLVIHWIFGILDSGSSEVVESIVEQQEPEQEVYYYQGKHPLCTMLIPLFEL